MVEERLWETIALRATEAYVPSCEVAVVSLNNGDLVSEDDKEDLLPVLWCDLVAVSHRPELRIGDLALPVLLA